MNKPKLRRWTPDEVLALKQLYLGARRHGDVKAFARTIGRNRRDVYAKWKELKAKHTPCAALLDGGPGALSYRERAATLLAGPAAPQKFL